MGRWITYADLNNDGNLELLVEDPLAVRARILDPLTGHTMYTLPTAYSQYWGSCSAGSPLDLETLIDEFDGTQYPEVVLIHRPGACAGGVNAVLGIIGWNGVAWVEEWRVSLPPTQITAVTTGRFAPGVQHLVLDDALVPAGGFVVRRPSDGAVVYDWRVEHPGLPVLSREIQDFDGDGLQEMLVTTQEIILGQPTISLHVVKWTGSVGAPGEGTFSSHVLLRQNAPNPFSRETEIVFQTPRRERALVRVFDPAGRLVRTLLEGTVNAGRQTLTWNGRNETGGSVASGTYFYEITVAGERQTRKMVRLE